MKYRLPGKRGFFDDLMEVLFLKPLILNRSVI